MSNNFLDPEKQQAMDLLLGIHRPAPGAPRLWAEAAGASLSTAEAASSARGGRAGGAPGHAPSISGEDDAGDAALAEPAAVPCASVRVALRACAGRGLAYTERGIRHLTGMRDAVFEAGAITSLAELLRGPSDARGGVGAGLGGGVEAGDAGDGAGGGAGGGAGVDGGGGSGAGGGGGGGGEDEAPGRRLKRGSSVSTLLLSALSPTAGSAGVGVDEEDYEFVPRDPGGGAENGGAGGGGGAGVELRRSFSAQRGWGGDDTATEWEAAVARATGAPGTLPAWLWPEDAERARCARMCAAAAPVCDARGRVLPRARRRFELYVAGVHVGAGSGGGGSALARGGDDGPPAGADAAAAAARGYDRVRGGGEHGEGGGTAALLHAQGPSAEAGDGAGGHRGIGGRGGDDRRDAPHDAQELRLGERQGVRFTTGESSDEDGGVLVDVARSTPATAARRPNGLRRLRQLFQR